MNEREYQTNEPEEYRDSEGRVIKKIERSPDGNVVLTTMLSYTESGELESITNLDKNGYTKSEEHRFYNQLGQLTEKVETSGSGKILYREENEYKDGTPGPVKKTVYQGGRPNEKIIYTYEYSPDGVVVKEDIIETNQNE